MLKILISHHTTPDVTTLRTLIFENVIPVLKSKTEISVTWFVYMPDKLRLDSQNSDITIFDIHDYKNAVELIERVKPDIIYASPYPNLPDIALGLAGKYLHIPTVGDIVNQAIVNDSITKMIKSNISAFFEKSVPTDTKENKKQFMRRGRFWIFKYRFLLRTQLATGMSLFKILKNSVRILWLHLSIWGNMNGSTFPLDYHFVEGELLMKNLLNYGFKKSSLILTGNPLYDAAFLKIQKLPQDVKNDAKIRVLLLTHSMYEHGFWTRTERDMVVKGIVSEICKHKDEISLVVKIHPSSENLAEYQALINPIDASIPIHQKGDIMEFLNASDVVIVYSTSSGPIQAMMLKKPIIMINVNLKGDLMLERDLVLECKDTSEIISLIKEVLLHNTATEQKVDSFIRDYLYKLDGHSPERMSNAIIEIVKWHNHNITNKNVSQ